MDRHAPIAVIGGSLVGPATESLLRRAGFTNVTTYEGSSITHPQSGGVMGLRDETLDLLRAIKVDTAELQALDSNNVHAFDMINREPQFRGSVSFPGVTTTWSLLHNALVDPIEITFRKRVVDLVEVPGDRARLVFSDGTETEPAMVIFADGRRSTGRSLMDPDRVLRYQGYVTWRGLVSDPPVELGLEGFHRYYDQRNGTLFSLTAPVKPTGESYWEYSHNLPVEEAQRLLDAHPTERPFLLGRAITDDTYQDFMHLVEQHDLPTMFGELITGRRTRELMLLPVNDLELPERAQWQVGKTTVALLADALIPARLQVGAGLNMGIKQAASLVRYLSSGQVLSQWEREAIDEIAPWIELGRSRAHRSNLGTYSPVRPGRTAVPTEEVWSTPKWVPA